MNDSSFWEGKSREVDTFLNNLSSYFSSKPIIDQTAQTIGHLNLHIADLKGEIKKLNSIFQNLTDSISSANESSTKLAVALNRITLAGSIIAALGLIIAVVGLFVK